MSRTLPRGTMYRLVIRPDVEKTFMKLEKKNPKQLEIISKKIEEILRNPFHQYKFLKRPFQNINRAHIDKHFVLTFEIEHEKRTVRILRYDHQDEVYR